MATLKILNSFYLDSQGSVKTGKQGSIASLITDTFDITVSGLCHHVTGELATATVITVYDDDNDFPAAWDYLFYWADQISYIQIIGTSQHVVFKVAAKQPFVLPGYDSLTAAGLNDSGATLITGGSEPSPGDIDSVAIGNYSGSTLNYLFAVID